MKTNSHYLFLICPDQELVTFLVKKWRGRRKHFGLFPGALCEHHNTNIIIAQPLDESKLAYATVRTLSHLYGPGQFLLVAPSISLVHSIYPADLAEITSARQFPYPANFDTRTPQALQLEINSVVSLQSIPQPVTITLLNGTPQPAIPACTAGHSTIPTPTRNLWRRCRARHNIDILARSAHGFIDAINDQNEKGFALAYVKDSFHDASAQEYRRRRLKTFNTIAEGTEMLMQSG